MTSLRTLVSGGALWSLAEAFTYPVLLLLLTPFLLHRLDAAGFGLWVFVYSIAGLGGVANLGMGTTTQRFVALARGAASGRGQDAAGSAAVVTQTLMIAAAGGLLVAAALWLLAPYLAEAWFARMQPSELTVLAIRVAALVLWCQQIESVFAAALRGMERFGTAARLEATTKLAGAAIVVAAVSHSPHAQTAMIAAAASGMLAALLKAWAVRRRLGVPIFVRPRADRRLLEFGFWTWTQGIASTLFQQADRLVLSALLGASALAGYAVAGQIGALVHSALSAAFSVILPRLSRQLADPASAGASHGREFLAASAIAVVLGGGFLLAIGRPMLELWLGPEAARHALPLYPWVLAAYLLLSLNVVPHFQLLALGHAKYVSLANLVAALASLAAVYPAVAALGGQGAALSRGLYAAVLSAAYLGYLLRERSSR